jgi:membrane associated rhomboid family serine protease
MFALWVRTAFLAFVVVHLTCCEGAIRAPTSVLHKFTTQRSKKSIAGFGKLRAADEHAEDVRINRIGAVLADSSYSSGGSFESVESVVRDLAHKPNIIKALCAVNGLLYLVWNIFGTTSIAAEQVLHDHFTSSVSNLRLNRWWTLLTSAFSHSSIYHLLSNTVTLLMIGPPVLRKLGENNFLSLVIVAAVGSSLIANIWNIFKIFLSRTFHWKTSYQPNETITNQYQIGFSGVNAALMSAFALTFPYSPMNLLGFISVSSIDALIMLLSLDCAGLLLQQTFLPTSVSHMTHIAGYLIGIAFMMFTGNKDYWSLLRTHGLFLADVVAIEWNRLRGF